MKKKYEKPIIGLVEFEVNEAIAGNCSGEPFNLDVCISESITSSGDSNLPPFSDDESCDRVVACYNTFMDKTISS